VWREDKANLVKCMIDVAVIILGTFVAWGWYIYKLLLKMYEESKVTGFLLQSTGQSR
jgi:hypothetical protein